MDVSNEIVPDDGIIYVFMHLEKTGGTTINTHFSQHLGFDDRFAHLGPWGNQARSQGRMPQPDEWPAKKRNRLRVISGHRVHATAHHLVEGRNARYFTFLRDPAGLVVSQYNHDASRLTDPPAFWEWYQDRAPNPQLNWCRHRLGVVTYNEVIDRLGEFWFVGVTEHLDRDLPNIFEAIGVPTEWSNRRVTGGGHDLEGIWPPLDDVVIERHQEVTEDVRERVAEDDRADSSLHRWARRRSNALREQYGWT